MDWDLAVGLLVAAVILSALVAWPVALIGLILGFRTEGAWRARRRKIIVTLAASTLILFGAVATNLFGPERPAGFTHSSSPPQPSIVSFPNEEPRQIVESETARIKALTEAMNSNALVFCVPLDDEVTFADCEYASRIRDNLELGSGGVQFPELLHRGETGRVKFAISKDDREAPVQEFLGAKPDKAIELKIGRYMAAQLEGEGFKIEPTELIHRDLYSGPGARWEWTVTALRASHYELELSAYVVASAPDGSKKEMLLKTLDLPLNVEVTWGQWFGDFMNDSTAWLTTGANWFKALTAFMLAAFGFFAVFRTKKRKRNRA